MSPSNILISGAYLKKNFKSTPHQRRHRRERLDDQVTDRRELVKVDEKDIHAVSHQDYLTGTVSITPLSALDFFSLLLHLLDEASENIKSGLARVLVHETRIKTLSVPGFQFVNSLLPRSSRKTSAMISSGSDGRE